jgi:tRNA modification GTPase
MVTLRQARLLEAAHDHLQRAARLLERDADHEIVSIEIQDGLERLRQILGIDTPPDVLDQIFSHFCIGK